jgi:hypothetical protein
VAAVEALPGTIAGTKALNDGRWHHLALVVADHDNNGSTDIAETKLYVDGEPDTLSNSTSALINTERGTSACLGGSDQSTTFNYNGYLDELRIFSYALTESEVQGLRNSNLMSGVMNGMSSNDSDEDGISNGEEEIAGTNPDDPLSFFKINAHSINSSGISLQWTGIPGRTYRVEESTDLSTWTLVPGIAPVVVTSPQAAASVAFPANRGSKCFLRIQVMLTP